MGSLGERDGIDALIRRGPQVPPDASQCPHYTPTWRQPEFSWLDLSDRVCDLAEAGDVPGCPSCGKQLRIVIEYVEALPTLASSIWKMRARRCS